MSLQIETSMTPKLSNFDVLLNSIGELQVAIDRLGDLNDELKGISETERPSAYPPITCISALMTIGPEALNNLTQLIRSYTNNIKAMFF